MNRHAPGFRNLIVAGLTVGLLLTSLAPAAVAYVGIDGSVRSDCCLATPAENCCGSACCDSPAPKQNRTPLPSEVNRHDLGKVNLCSASSFAARIDEAQGLATDGGWNDSVFVASRTLVGQHVRLQI